MPYINDIYVKEVVGANGLPAIEVTVETESGATSKVIYNDEQLNPNQAIAYLNEKVAPKLIGYDVREQILIDHKLNEFDDNDVLAISTACQIASCNYQKKYPYENLGGCLLDKLPKIHFVIGNNIGMFKSLAISFNDQMKVVKQYKLFADIMKYFNKDLNKPLNNFNEDSLKILIKTIQSTGLKLGSDIYLHGTIYAEYVADNKGYLVGGVKPMLSRATFTKFINNLIANYSFSSIDEQINNLDFDGKKSFMNLTESLNHYETFNDSFKTIKDFSNQLQSLKGLKKINYNNQFFKINHSLMIDLITACNVDAVEIDSSSIYGITAINELIRIEERINEILKED